VVHAFFPENLKKAKPTWKGKNVFSLTALLQFEQDVKRVRDFFFADRGYLLQGRLKRRKRVKPRPQALSLGTATNGRNGI
jgi:hypothetical protein